MANQPRKSLTRVQEFKLGDMIRAHCKRIDDYAVYEEGWTDERCQQEMGGPEQCSINSVQNIRRELVGDLRQQRLNSSKGKIEDLEKRVTELEKQVAMLLDARTRPSAPIHPVGRPPSRPPGS